MKTIPSGFQAILNSNSSSLISLWKITRTDSEVFYLTDCDTNVIVDGNEYYSSPGITPSNLEISGNLSVSNAEFRALLNSEILSEVDLRLGFFDYAEIEVSVRDYENLEEPGFLLLSGRLGEIKFQKGVFTAELRGLTNDLRKNILATISPTCRADLGDSKCKIPLIPPDGQRSTSYSVGDTIRIPIFFTSNSTKYGDLMFVCTVAGITASTQPPYSTLIDGITVDGTAQFITKLAWAYAKGVSLIDSDKTFGTPVIGHPSGWFTGGILKFETGLNAGLIFDIKLHVADSEVDFFSLWMSPPFTIQEGDIVLILTACDKTLNTCVNKFDNAINFRGEPFLPGSDYLLRYAK